MTTIVIDFEDHVVYSDDLQTRTEWSESYFTKRKYNERLRYKSTTKSHKVGEEVIITGVGCAATIEGFAQGWPNSIPDPDRPVRVFVCTLIGDTFRVVMYTPKKKMFGKTWEISNVIPTGRYVTSGSGEDFAQGALAAGASPEDSIIAASKCDSGTSANVSKLGFDK